METIIRMLPEFEHRAKAMAKKYKSFVQDYKIFIESLKTAPKQGKSLGGGVYKIRIPISSKTKGKSGGARILTYTVNKVSTDMFIVVLMSIYDKSEMENVSDAYLKNILKKQSVLHDIHNKYGNRPRKAISPAGFFVWNKRMLIILKLNR